MSEQELTEDEQELLRLIDRDRQALSDETESAILAHYRKARAEAVHKEQERIEAELRAMAPSGLYRNVLDLAKQIGRRMSGCNVRAAPDVVGSVPSDAPE